MHPLTVNLIRIGPRRRRRRGYVLVLALGLITLAALSLAGLARYSLNLATASQSATEELQRRWGLLSVETILLDRSNDILLATAPTSITSVTRWPQPGSASMRFKLGELLFDVVVSDEDSKINLNTVYAVQSERVPETIRRVCKNLPFRTLSMPGGSSTNKPFGSWGQVFDLQSATNSQELCRYLQAVNQSLTCWGSGRLNLRRASDAAVGEVAALELSADEIARLLTIRKGWNGQSIDDIFAQLGLRQSKRAAAQRLFGTESQCLSLVVRIENGQRVWSYQFVNDGQQNSFAW